MLRLKPSRANKVASKRRAASLLRLAARRSGAALLAVAGASVLVWALLPLAAGDVAERILRARGVENPSRIEIAQVREELQLDRPLVNQYFVWALRAARGDLSISYQTGKPVAREIADRFPATALLALVALVFSLALSVSAGLAGAAFAGKPPDRMIQFLTQAGAAMPAFLLGLLLLQFVVVALGIGKVVATDSLSDVLLPALCLSIGRAAEWAQLLRANLLEALNSRFVMVATARGASRWRVLWRYALPNALVPLLTAVGVGVGSLLGGAAIIETVFSFDGLGAYAVRAIAARDLPVVQGFVIVGTLIYIAASFAVDLIAWALDPRLRTEKNFA